MRLTKVFRVARILRPTMLRPSIVSKSLRKWRDQTLILFAARFC